MWMPKHIFHVSCFTYYWCETTAATWFWFNLLLLWNSCGSLKNVSRRQKSRLISWQQFVYNCQEMWEMSRTSRCTQTAVCSARMLTSQWRGSGEVNDLLKRSITWLKFNKLSKHQWHTQINYFKKIFIYIFPRISMNGICVLNIFYLLLKYYHKYF